MNLCYNLYTSLSTEFTTFDMLAHESLLLYLYWLLNGINSFCHGGSKSLLLSLLFPIHRIYYCICFTISPRFTASVMLAHASVLLSLYCSIHMICNICHEDSSNLCCYNCADLSMRFTASVMQAHASLLLSLQISCYLSNPCY
jgi:hypothetical protein